MASLPRKVQLGNDIQPREMYSELDIQRGTAGRMWNDWVSYLHKFSGMRGSMLSFAQWCGQESFFRNSGPGAGDSSNMVAFNIQNPSGTMATQLQIRGTLAGAPDPAAEQELMVLAITDQLMSIGFDPAKVSETPVLTETNPII